MKRLIFVQIALSMLLLAPLNAQIKKIQNGFSQKNVKTILEENFPTFFSSIKRAGYSALLENAENITVFAPTEDAFNSLKQLIGPDAYEAIFNPRNERDLGKLQNIIKLHIIPGRILANELINREYLIPVNEERKLDVSQDAQGKVKIDDSTVIDINDIVGTNGIVHTIDAVIM